MFVVATVGAAAATGLLSLLTGLAFARSACRRVFNREPPALLGAEGLRFRGDGS